MISRGGPRRAITRGVGSMSPSGQYGSDEARTKINEAQSLLKKLVSDSASAQNAFNDGIAKIQSAGVQSAVDDANQRVGQTIQKISSWATQQQSQLSAIQVPPAQPNFFPQSDKIWHDVNDLESQIAQNGQALQAALSLMPSILSGAQTAATRASAGQQQTDTATVQRARTQALALMSQGNFDAATATLQTQSVADAATRVGYDLSGDLGAIANARTTATSGKQQQTDTATVQRARAQSLALMNQGNYDGALAVLQSQNVADAASRIGYDLSPDVSVVTGNKINAQRSSDAQTAATKAQSDCATAGGSWTGTYCDTTAVRVSKSLSDANAKVDAAITQANALAGAGSYRAALAALAGAASAAQVAGRASDVAVQIEQVKDQQAESSCASRGGSWDGNSCVMPVSLPQAPPPPPVALPPPALDPQTACIQAGGSWDGSNCAAPPPSWIKDILPTLLRPSAPSPQPGGYATSGPSQEQLMAIAILQAFGGAQGAQLAAALSGSMSPQGPLTPAPQGAPDGTPCAKGDGSAGIFQGGQCRTVAPPSGMLYGAPSAGESF